MKLKKNRDYTLVYRNNLQIGKASVVIRGMGNLPEKNYAFKIVPQTPKNSEIEEKQEIVCDYLFEWQNGTWVPDGSFDGIFLRCEKNTEIYIERKPF